MALTLLGPFLKDLVRRGLRGVRLVTSDAHEGLKAAVSKVLCATWQRCRVGPLRTFIPPVRCPYGMAKRDGRMLRRRSRGQLGFFVCGSLRDPVPGDHLLARADRISI